jgi:2-dehydro-3-deoxyphosphooctonate aldolase (KDO 8-P synthase)
MLERFTLIAGPCLLEDDALNLRIARELARLSVALGLPVIFKGSFDKANRARLEAPRGPGLEAGLEMLARVKGETGLPVVTDIHEPWHAEKAGATADVLQIPAFLCRQTDLLVAAGGTGRAVNVKKGQWMAPDELAHAVHKVRSAGSADIAVTERGTFFGYGDLVVDMRSFARLREACGAPAYFDAGHSVQRPGLADGASAGDPEHVPALARAAVAAGCDGLFLETHPDPHRAPSDRATLFPLGRLEGLLAQVVALRDALGRSGGAS